MRFSDDTLTRRTVIRNEETGAVQSTRTVIQTLADLADGVGSVRAAHLVAELRRRGVTEEELSDTTILNIVEANEYQRFHWIIDFWPESESHGQRVRVNGYNRVSDPGRDRMEYRYQWSNRRVKVLDVSDQECSTTATYALYHHAFGDDAARVFSADAAEQAVRDQQIEAFDKIGWVEAADLSGVFELSQHAHHEGADPWHAREQVELSSEADPERIRSTAVGDLIQNTATGDWYIVQSIGFRKVPSLLPF